MELGNNSNNTERLFMVGVAIVRRLRLCAPPITTDGLMGLAFTSRQFMCGAKILYL
jgi:hypothetical protein